MKQGNTVRYVTRYALTTGIVKAEGHHFTTGSFVWGRPSTGVGKSEHFATLEEAEAHALVMRDKKIKALQKQIEKLKAVLLETAGELDNASLYVGDYFREKYRMDDTVREAREAAEQAKEKGA